jgi:hypothetical protein
MSSDYDATEFIDTDFQAHKTPYSASGGPGPAQRAPSREEVDTRVVETQQRLVELKRAQEELEREKSALEETRRRQHEFQTGRQEMLQNLTRGQGLLEEAEFSARRDAEQMSKTLTDFREAIAKVEAIREEGWTQENFAIELTRALTTLENARMEWNSARLKHAALGDAAIAAAGAAPASAETVPSILAVRNFGELCRIGFALTWPVALVALVGFISLALVLLRR